MFGSLTQLIYKFYLWIILLVVIVYYVRKWLKKRRKIHSLFERLGIPYVKPHLIYGSFHLLKNNQKQNELETMRQWIEKYGKVFGYFVGLTPYLSISDLDLVRIILVKEFVNFANRPTLVIKADPVIHTLVGLRDKRWKDVRSLLTPTFTSSKMKLISKAMNIKVDVMFKIVEKSSRCDEAIDINRLYQGLTLDVISDCALAMKTNCQEDQDKDPFFFSVRMFLHNAINPAVKLAIYFPLFAKLLAFVSNNLALSGRATKMIKENLQRVILDRRNNPHECKVDVLQLMLDASEDLQKEGDKKNAATKERAKKTLSDQEIIANAWVFLLGGYETTAAALTFTSYLLAKHPQIQKRLYEEIKKTIKNGQNHVSYDDVFQLSYLDQVISESLRLFPPVVTFISREAKEDILIENLFIPKGTCVSVPVWQIHHDPELWPKPNDFDPERFSTQSKIKANRHPMSYIPFGEGPRQCIGKRFGYMETKIALARLISDYKLEICDQTPDILTFNIRTVTLNPAEKIFIKLKKRSF